ncbi:MAG: Na(+)-translocating NADH-quinone reductase subunit B [Lentisphaerae bacterium ADurb.BinA184]|nr:MAG: Na(+)-translocating NADH-quinone reductase subunit B [Lentisphaerae bacterium ADurb.BinA184]
MSDQATKRPPPPRRPPRFRRQKIMERVLLALLPVFLGALYFFGWRVAAMLVWVAALGCGAEYLLARRRGDPLTGSCLVTCALFALSLPPTLPFWMAAVGIVVGIVFGKELFGGFGRNIFNPAVVGRAFIFVSFPIEMTARFTPVWRGGLAGLAHWGPPRSLDGVEALTAATPMWFRRDFGFTEAFPLWDQVRALFLGNLGGVYDGADGARHMLAAGSVGEVSTLLILIGGIYLLATRTANWRLVAGSLGGAAAAALLFRHLLGVQAVPPLPWTLCSGALAYAGFFMVTDPVSAPADRRAQWIYAAFIGAMIVFLRWKAIFAGGVAFAIILGNTLGPSLDMLCRRGAARARPARE